MWSWKQESLKYGTIFFDYRVFETRTCLWKHDVKRGQHLHGRRKLLHVVRHYTLFLTSNTFISNARLKLPKNQVNAKQHTEAELLLFENYSHSSSHYHPKIIGHILKKQKSKFVCILEIIQLIIMKIKMKMKNKSQRYGINRPTILGKIFGTK